MGHFEILLTAWALVGAVVAFLQLRRATLHGKAVIPGRQRVGDGASTKRWEGAVASRGFAARLRAALATSAKPTERLLALEEVLIKADVGMRSTQILLDRLRAQLTAATTLDEALKSVGDEMKMILAVNAAPAAAASMPHVILVLGVNGVGKTTSVAKLAHCYKTAGHRVLVVGADTFRAAASEQLANWAAKVGVDCVRRDGPGDPSAVVFDGIQAARSRNMDVMIIDTAGRLHVKANLVAELKKFERILGRHIEGAPHECLLVVDATTGQNASSQARTFSEALPLTGIILTKLDGTARGGAVFAVTSDIGLPVRYVGFGEGISDFAEFDPRAFVDGLLATRM